jgi:hypothetical protein
MVRLCVYTIQVCMQCWTQSVANVDQNHLWATRYCQKTGSNWPKFKYLGEYKYYSIYILFSGYSIK